METRGNLADRDILTIMMARPHCIIKYWSHSGKTQNCGGGFRVFVLHGVHFLFVGLCQPVRATGETDVPSEKKSGWSQTARELFYMEILTPPLH